MGWGGRERGKGETEEVTVKEVGGGVGGQRKREGRDGGSDKGGGGGRERGKGETEEVTKGGGGGQRKREGRDGGSDKGGGGAEKEGRERRRK